MEYYLNSITPIIEANYENFTSLEKTIADFFIQNQEKIDFSAKNISEKLFVSEASISRFAKKCGYRGYREFIYQYEKTFSEKRELIAGRSRIVFDVYQELLNKTCSLMDENQLKRMCRYLNESTRVSVAGMGSSEIAAREIELRFMRIGVDIDCIHNTDLMRMQAVFQNESCLVIGISISGEKEEVLYFLKESHKRKAKTVLITAKNKEEYNEFCTEVILVPSLKYLKHGDMISPQFPVLVMTDLLYSYYIEQDKYEKEILQDDTLKALKRE